MAIRSEDSASEGPDPSEAGPDITILEPGSEQVYTVAGHDRVLRVGSRSNRRAQRPTFRPPGVSSAGVSPGYLPLAPRSTRSKTGDAVVGANGYRLVADEDVQLEHLPSLAAKPALPEGVAEALQEAQQADADPDWLPEGADLATDDDEPGAFVSEQSVADILVDNTESDNDLADEIPALDPDVRRSLVRPYPVELRLRDVTVKGGRDTVTVKNVSFNVKPAELTTLVAATDNVVDTLIDATSGRVHYAGQIHYGGWRLDDRSRAALRSCLIAVATGPRGYVDSVCTVTEYLAQAIELRQPALSSRQRRALLSAVQYALPLEPVLRRPISSLTPVESHWVALAEVVVTQSPVVVWDGFGVGLSTYQMRAVLEMVRLFARDGLWSVVLSNPTDQVMMRCERVIAFSEATGPGSGAEVCFDGPPRQLCRFFQVDHAEELRTSLLRPVDWPTRWRTDRGYDLTDAGKSLQFARKGVPTGWTTWGKQYAASARSAVGSHLRYAESLWSLTVPTVLVLLGFRWWFGTDSLAWESGVAARFVSAVPVGLSVLMVLAATAWTKPLGVRRRQWVTGRSVWAAMLGTQSVVLAASVFVSVLFCAVFAYQGGPEAGAMSPWRAAEQIVVTVCAGLAIFGLASLVTRAFRGRTAGVTAMVVFIGWLALTSGGLVRLSGQFSPNLLSLDNLSAVVAWSSPSWLASSALGASSQVLIRQPGCATSAIDGCRAAWAAQPQSVWVPLCVLAGIATVSVVVGVLLSVRAVTTRRPALESHVSNAAGSSVAGRVLGTDTAWYYLRFVASLAWFAVLCAVALCILLDGFGLFGAISYADPLVPKQPSSPELVPDDAPVA